MAPRSLLWARKWSNISTKSAIMKPANSPAKTYVQNTKASHPKKILNLAQTPQWSSTSTFSNTHLFWIRCCTSRSVRHLGICWYVVYMSSDWLIGFVRASSDWLIGFIRASSDWLIGFVRASSDSDRLIRFVRSSSDWLIGLVRASSDSDRIRTSKFLRSQLGCSWATDTQAHWNWHAQAQAKSRYFLVLAYK